MENKYFVEVGKLDPNLVMFEPGVVNGGLQAEFDSIIVYDPESSREVDAEELASNIGYEFGSVKSFDDLVVYDPEGVEEDVFENPSGSEIASKNSDNLEAELFASKVIIDDPKEVPDGDVQHSTNTFSGNRSEYNYEDLIEYDLEADEESMDIEDIVHEFAGPEYLGVEEESDDESNLESDEESMDIEDIVYEYAGPEYPGVEEESDDESNLEADEESMDIEDIVYEYAGPEYPGVEEESDDESNIEAENQVAGSHGIINKGRPRRGRKRKIPNQSRADRKKLCNTNKTHINTKGNVYVEKSFNEHFECMCSRNCTEVVPVRDRRRLFTQFWSMGTFEGRCAFLLCCVTEVPKKRSYSKRNIKNRSNTRYYSIYGKPVCQKTLLRTLQINESRVTTALKKYMTDESLCDLRGKLRGGWNALPLSKTLEVRVHIASFPKYISHYTRGKTESKYLSGNLSLAKMYELYEEEASKPVTRSFYNKIFYTFFNLRFKKPKKDTCYNCDINRIKQNSSVGAELQMLKEWHEGHLARADSLQAQLKADCDAAKIDIELETLTLDMQKTLILPKVPTSIAYFKRQLNLNNLGIHSGSTGQGQFNLWTEDEASKGTQEVGSCLKLHIENITKPIKRLILWSDSCGGQNRSIKLVLMMIFILQNHKTLESISMRYLLSGHSFLPNDTEFADAETAIKRCNELYTDEDYIRVMKKCRTKNVFDVNRMSPDNFYSVQGLEALITNRKVDLNNQKVSWLDAHEILIEKNQPGILKIRKDISGPFQTVNINKIRSELNVKDMMLGALWPTGRPLSKEKVKDLKDMMELVPQEHRYFFEERLNRVQTADFIDDVDGFGQSIDFDLELYDM